MFKHPINLLFITLQITSFFLKWFSYILEIYLPFQFLLIPDDHSRVCLLPDKFSSSDYINANYLTVSLRLITFSAVLLKCKCNRCNLLTLYTLLKYVQFNILICSKICYTSDTVLMLDSEKKT